MLLAGFMENGAHAHFYIFFDDQVVLLSALNNKVESRLILWVRYPHICKHWFFRHYIHFLGLANDYLIFVSLLGKYLPQSVLQTLNLSARIHYHLIAESLFFLNLMDASPFRRFSLWASKLAKVKTKIKFTHI